MKYNDCPFITNEDMLNKIIEIKDRALTDTHIRSLVHGEIHAIVLKGFYDNKVLNSILEKILNSSDRSALYHAIEFERIGYAYSEIFTEEQRAQYHKNALKNISIVRELFNPASHPIDEFKLLLKKVWPSGACLLKINSQNFFVGICRFMNPGVDLKPHTDKLERNLTSSQQINIKLESQLSVNVYVKMPEEGGEVEFWDIEPTDQQYEELKGNRHYGICRETLPTPVNKYKPEQGDLLILNSRRIHAVKPVFCEQRITVSCFVGYHAINSPLTYWS